MPEGSSKSGFARAAVMAPLMVFAFGVGVSGPSANVSAAAHLSPETSRAPAELAQPAKQVSEAAQRKKKKKKKKKRRRRGSYHS